MISRAAFKLEQMQARYKFLAPGNIVIDLGRYRMLAEAVQQREPLIEFRTTVLPADGRSLRTG